MTVNVKPSHSFETYRLDRSDTEIGCFAKQV